MSKVSPTITLEFFTRSINSIKEVRDREKALAAALAPLTDGRPSLIFADRMENCFIELLARQFGDDAEFFLSWWLYDKEFGEGNLKMYDENKTEIPTDTIEDAYNYLCTLAH